MARLVVPRRPGFAQFASADSVNDLPPDKYRDRLVKYIPAETIAFFSGRERLLSEADKSVRIRRRIQFRVGQRLTCSESNRLMRLARGRSNGLSRSGILRTKRSIKVARI